MANTAREPDTKSQEQNEFEEQLLSSMECFQNNETTLEETGSSMEKKNLPILDLFMNPSRAEEEDQMLKKIEERKNSVVHNKVS